MTGGWRRIFAGAGVLLLATVAWPRQAGSAPATEPADPPATQPGSRAEDQIRLNYKDAPLDAVLEELSQAAGFVVVKETPVEGRVTVMSMRPVTRQEGITLLDTVLKANGFTAVQNGRTLRIVARDKAKKGNIPVHFGADPASIDDSDELITQVIPIHNVDAVKLESDLKPLIGPEADLTANGGSNTIIITDSSANIRRVVQIVSVLDRREGAASDIRIIQLKNASATAAAKLVLAIFRPEEPQAKNGQPPPQPPPQQRETKVGSGVDQALYGGKVTAAADERTNTVVVAGPSETVKLVENMLHELDANPATSVTIKSFHLKAADADAVARVITSSFEGAAQSPQARGLGDQPLHAHVTAAAEDRTNTVVVTAPSATMAVVEGIINDLESTPVADSSIRSFRLRYADADMAAKVLMSAFHEGRTEGSRRRFARPLEQMTATPDERTNTVVITGSSQAMEVAEKLIQDLDISPTAGSAVKFFHLKQADALTAAKMIDDFFKPPEGQQRSEEEQRRHVGVNAQADERSNTIAVSAPPDSMKVVDEMVQEIETNPLTSYDIRTYQLAYADAQDTSKLLMSIFSPEQGQTSEREAEGHQALRTKVIAAADDRTNAVVVTAPPDTLRVIDGMIKLLDANPASGADMKVFQLQYADADSAAKLVQSIFQPTQQNGKGQPANASHSHHTPPVTAASDDRTNTLVVTAPPDVLKVIEALVRQLDSNPTAQQTFFIVRLRNGQSTNMSYVLNQLFGNVQGPGGTGTPGAPGSAGQPTQQTNRNNGAIGQLGATLGGLRSFGSALGAPSGGTGIGARRGTQSYGTPLSGGINLPPGMAQVVNELTGQVFVVADPDTNSLLVTTATKYERQVRQIIAELDRPVPQVLIKVLVAEVTHDNSADFGLDFSILNQRSNGHGQSFGQTFGNPGAGLVVSFVEANLNATLHALAQQGKLDVLSRPYILASDNQLASITVGQEVPFVTNTQVTAFGQTLNTIQYQDIGIILDVTPHINPEGLVILDVSPEISQLTGQTVPISEQVSAPVIAKRSAESRVGIRNGQTIVIGGLMEDRKTSTINKVPILGDIPLIGYLFSRTQVDKTKTELLIFLTPHVAQEPDTLSPMSQDEMKGTQLTPRAVGPGVFDEHMRGMARGEVPETQPTTRSMPSVLEFHPDAATQPAAATTEPIHLPKH